MEKIIKTAEKTLQLLKNKGAQDALVQASITESCEYSVEANKFSLIRSTFDQSLTSKAFIDNKIGSSSNNQFNELELDALTTKTVDTAKASLPDEANVIAPNQGRQEFFGNLEEQDSEWMHKTLVDFLEERSRLFPKTIIENAVLKFSKESSALLSSTGSFLTSSQNTYGGFVMFTSKDGKKASSFNYVSFSKNKDSVSLMQTSGLRELIAQSNEQTDMKKLPQKFTGEIIVTPHCMDDFMSAILSYIQTEKLLRKQSFLQNKLNSAVASPLLTVRSAPLSNEFAHKIFWDSEGFITEGETIFEKGVLKNYILNDFGARKLNEKRSKAVFDRFIVERGEKKFLDMVKSVKRGLLVARFSGGAPSESGDFSGIAKNSYYIENGEIQFPVSEVMISGNFSKLIQNIVAVSSEAINSGSYQYPWMQFSDIVVS